MWEGTCLTSMKLSTGYIPRAEFVSIMNNNKNIYIFYYQFIEIKCPSTHGIYCKSKGGKICRLLWSDKKQLACWVEAREK